VLYAYSLGSVSAERFGILIALGFVAFAYVGGITMVSGAVFAGLISVEALVPYALEKWFGVSGNYALLFAGLALIVTLIQNPDGVAGATWRKRHAKQARARAEAAPEAAA
jgi:branched-chain amino acid transport system permease protein